MGEEADDPVIYGIKRRRNTLNSTRLHPLSQVQSHNLKLTDIPEEKLDGKNREFGSPIPQANVLVQMGGTPDFSQEGSYNKTHTYADIEHEQFLDSNNIGFAHA